MDIDGADITRDLPFTPPPGVRRPLMWIMARQLLADHIAGPDGLCTLCRPAALDPCPVRQIAARGLRASSGRADGPTGRTWLNVVRQRLAAGEIDPLDAVAEALAAAQGGRGRWRYTARR